MTEYNLGTARGRIEIEYAGNRGVNEAERGLRGLGRQSSTTGQAIAATGRVSGIAGLAIAGGLALAVNSAAKFEKGLSAIKAVSGATAGEMEKVRAKALQIGKDTSFSAMDAAQAMEELSKAGVTTADILSGAADATVALAAAGEVDLPFAAGIASNAMNQFGLAAKDLPRVADLIAGAANASAIDVKDFGYSLSQVGAVAKLAGLSFEDTSIAIAELGNAGIKGSDAGTSLKSMLSRLQPTTVKTTALFKELGLMTKDGSNKFYDQQGNLKSLRDVQEILGKSLQGMTKQQQQATLNTLFGSDAIRAAAILAGNGAKGYDKLATAINKTKAADVAKTRMDNLMGSFEAFKGSVETLAIQLGTVLLPTLRKITDQLNSLVGWFLSLSDGQQKAIVYTALAVAGFLLFVAATIKIVTMMREFIAIIRIFRAVMAIGPILTAVRFALLGLSTALRAFGLAMYAALGPVGLIILAIIAFIAIMVLLYNKNETVRAIIKSVWNFIKNIIGSVVGWITGTAVPAVVRAWNSVTAATRALGRWFASVWNSIRTATSNAWNFVRNTTVGAWNAVRNAIVNSVRAVWSYISGRFNAIRGLISAVWNTARALTTAAWNAIRSIIVARINAFMVTVRGIRSRVAGALAGAGGWLVNAGRQIIQGLINGITGMLGSLRNRLASVTNLIPDWKGPPQKDAKLLTENGKLIMRSLMLGLGSELGALQRMLSGIGGDIPSSFITSAVVRNEGSASRRLGSIPAPRGESGSPVTFNVYNPVEEPTSVTTTRTMTRAAQLGVFG